MKKRALPFLLALLALLVFAITACTDEKGEESMENKISVIIGETKLTATLAENAAATALAERVKESPITIGMSDYGGWEKVGSFGFDLPTSDEQITTNPCEFVLYQGDQLVIFYGSNRWSYTQLGKIDSVTQAELAEILGSGDVTVTLAPAE